MGQIAAGGPSELLGTNTSGASFVLPLHPGGIALRLAEELNPGALVAAGHGRIAAHRRDGALWVLECAGRNQRDRERQALMYSRRTTT